MLHRSGLYFAVYGGLSFSTLIQQCKHNPMAPPTEVDGNDGPCGLQVSLPPLFAWGTDYDQLVNPIRAIMESLSENTRTPAPLHLMLRLFPDSSLALLRETGARHHSVPLDVFTRLEQPWGSALDPHRALRQGIEGLTYVLERLGPQCPVTLILPSRLLVTQFFCDELFSRLSKLNLVNIAVELPSTSVVLASPRNNWKDLDVTRHWLHLSTLATPWAQLREIPALAPTLKHNLDQHTLLPLHVLLPWVTSRGMLREMDVGLVVDTVPPEGEMKDFMDRAYLAQDGMKGDGNEEGEQKWYVADHSRHDTAKGNGHSAATDALLKRNEQKRKEAAEHRVSLEKLSTVFPKQPGNGGSDLLLEAPSDDIRNLILSSIAETNHAQKTLVEKVNDILHSTTAESEAAQSNQLQQLLMTPEEQHSLLQSKLRQAMRLKEVEATQEQNDTVTEEPVPSLYPPGYWDCLRHLRASWGVQYVCGMPSYHMEQARRWRREMHHHGLARLPFLPTVLPALRPMEVEAQRVLREGSRRHAAGSSGWLPNSMQTSFTDALQSLPTEYKRYCLRGSLRYYSPKQLFYVQPHASLVRGDDPQGIVIQRKERDIPFGYQSSERLEKEQAAVLALFEEEASSISATEEQFVSECTLPTLENVATTSSAYDGLTLCIPTPGVQTTTLKQSWAALTLK